MDSGLGALPGAAPGMTIILSYDAEASAGLKVSASPFMQ